MQPVTPQKNHRGKATEIQRKSVGDSLCLPGPPTTPAGAGCGMLCFCGVEVEMYRPLIYEVVAGQV